MLQFSNLLSFLLKCTAWTGINPEADWLSPWLLTKHWQAKPRWSKCSLWNEWELQITKMLLQLVLLHNGKPWFVCAHIVQSYIHLLENKFYRFQRHRFTNGRYWIIFSVHFPRKSLFYGATWRITVLRAADELLLLNLQDFQRLEKCCLIRLRGAHRPRLRLTFMQYNTSLLPRPTKIASEGYTGCAANPPEGSQNSFKDYNSWGWALKKKREKVMPDFWAREKDKTKHKGQAEIPRCSLAGQKTRKPPFAVLLSGFCFHQVGVKPNPRSESPFRATLPSSFRRERKRARARRWGGEWGCGWRGILAPGYFTMLLKHPPPSRISPQLRELSNDTPGGRVGQSHRRCKAKILSLGSRLLRAPIRSDSG